MSSGSVLPPQEHASFAVLSRLISCLVTEQILRAFYVPFCEPVRDATGLMVVLSIHTISENVNVYRPFRSEDIFVMIPLRHSPILKDHQTRKHGQLVGLVDPLDMLPIVYEFEDGKKEDYDVRSRQLLKTENLTCILGLFDPTYIRLPATSSMGHVRARKPPTGF
jgi:hypothetical protein